MTKRTIINNQFEGGWAVDKKVGIKNSFDYAQSVDFRVSPSQLTLLGQPMREDNGVVKDLIQNEVMTTSGEIYSIGDSGAFYRRTPGGEWGNIGDIGFIGEQGGFGLSYRPDQDSIYIAGTKSVSLYNPLSTGPSLSVGYYGASMSIYDNSDTMGFNVSAFQNNGSTTTSIGTVINESDSSRRYFQSDIEPLSSIDLNIISKGTGDWTVIIHDGLNNELATSTITNTNLINNQFNSFKFDKQVRIQVAPSAQTYHIHVITNGEMITNGDFEVDTSGWTAVGTGATITRVTSGQHSGIACADITASSGIRSAKYSVNMIAGHTYTLTAWVNTTTAQNVYAYLYGPNISISGFGGTTGTGWQQWTATFTPTSSANAFDISVNSADFLLDDVTLVGPDAGGIIASTIQNNLSSCDLEIFADRLVDSPNGMHPIENFLQYVMIGNERYLSVWEPLGDPVPDNSEWSRHMLQFPATWQVCGLATTNEYIVIACEQINTSDNTPQQGILFFWDGIQTATNTNYGQYNYFVNIPEGSPYGLHTYKNVIYYEAGGAWYALSSVDSQPTKLRTLPFGEHGLGNNNNKTVIYPYAATTRNGIQLMAYPSITTNPNIPYGVYSWGQVDVNFPNTFGLNYLLSTGTQNWSDTNNLTIGMVKNFGDTLHISWRDDEHGSYGLDVINSTSDVVHYANWESLIYDAGYPGKQKEADYMNATWLPLPDGVRLRFKYSVDRGDWVYSQFFSNTETWFNGDGYMSFSIGQENEQARFNELQIGMEVFSDEGVKESPIITSITLVYDDMTQEQLNNG